MKFGIATLAMIAMAAGGNALAVCPHTVGVFGTAGGQVLPGRVSEAWCGGYPGQTGNVENAESWDGSGLGTQWRVWGMSIDAAGAVLIADTINPTTGNGTRTYQTFYDGGQYWLDGAGDWGDGFNDLTGSLTSYMVVTTITYIRNNPVGATSNVSFTGDFGACPNSNGCVIEFGIANAMLVWRPGLAPLPAAYPAFLCGATGELFDACCITISIQCTVPTEDSTWGSLKGLYR